MFDKRMKRFADFFEEVFDKYYEENPAWGSLHIVMADQNADKGSLEFCKKQALEQDDLEGYWLAHLLEVLTRRERYVLHW